MVTCLNEQGYSYPQISVPESLAAMIQKPAEPVDVHLESHSSNSLKVLWMHPESDGGDTLTKYKIEWDTSSAFDSADGTTLGSTHKFVNTNKCDESHCSLIISGLTKGVNYYIRVFSYNSYGYSAKAAIPVEVSDIPKTQPTKPVKVYASESADTKSVKVQVKIAFDAIF